MAVHLRIVILILSLIVVASLVTCMVRGEGARYRLVTITDQTFALEIADPAVKMRGLRGRSTLAPDYGWIVQLAKPEILSYSTRDTDFPIDILYLDGQGMVVQIDTLEPNDERPTASVSRSPVCSVIQLRGGTARQLRVYEGYMLRLNRSQ